MARHPHDQRHSTPAIQRARERGANGDTGRVVKDNNGVHVDLDVKVEDLGDLGVDIHETLPASWVTELLDDEREPRWTARDDARLELHLEHEASFVRVKGHVKLALSHPCVRCLNDVPFAIDLRLDLRLVERAPGPVEADLSDGEGDGEDFEGQPLGDAADLEDLDIASYQGDKVKVADLLREQLFLELPMHPACDSPRARPEHPCAFDEERANAGESEGWRESRWSGLASLRDKLPPGPADKTEKPMTTSNKLDPQKAAKIYGATDHTKETVKIDMSQAAAAYEEGHQTQGAQTQPPQAAPVSSDAKSTRKIPAIPDEEIDDEDIVEAHEDHSHGAIALPGKKTKRPQEYSTQGPDDGAAANSENPTLILPVEPIEDTTIAVTPSAKKKAKPAAKKAKPAAKKAKPAAKKAKPVAKKAKPAATKKAKPAAKKAKASKKPAKKAKAAKKPAKKAKKR